MLDPAFNPTGRMIPFHQHGPLQWADARAIMLTATEHDTRPNLAVVVTTTVDGKPCAVICVNNITADLVQSELVPTLEREMAWNLVGWVSHGPDFEVGHHFTGTKIKGL
jgi:hypothetical protein